MYYKSNTEIDVPCYVYTYFCILIKLFQRQTLDHPVCLQRFLLETTEEYLKLQLNAQGNVPV